MVFLFAITLFIGAAMLFIAELMFARMILPMLGGTPAVWNTCTVFFQAALLAGYGYAHMATSRLKIKKQVFMHLAILVLPLLVLPIAIPRTWAPPAESDPIGSILLLMLITIGLPFTVVSTSAPLIQRWFAYTGHKAGKDPYFLYAASNLGSFAGLIGYIVFLEPRFGLAEQSRLWQYGYVGLALLTGICAMTVFSSLRKRVDILEEPKDESEDKTNTKSNAACELLSEEPVTLMRQIRWLLLAFAPSSLLLGFTTYITTDITSVPLLWVVPLSLYLFTFIIAFSRRNFIPQKALIFTLPVFVLIQTVILPHTEVVPTWFSLGLNMVTFFIAALACHGELASDRPAAAYLTKFYLLVSAGGALGGLFNGLVAPLVFSSVVEYPAVMVMACLLCLYHPASAKIRKTVAQDKSLNALITDVIYVVAVSALAVWIVVGVTRIERLNEGNYFVAALAAIAFAVYSLVRKPLRFGIALVLVLIILAVGLESNGDITCQKRSFFGVLRVKSQTIEFDGKPCPVNFLVHGTTFHGVQILSPEYRDTPISYFYRTGPLGQVFTSYNALGRLHDIGVTGLGAGTIACYAQSGQSLTYYEIDPLVKEVAEDPKYFTFLSDAKARGVDLKVVLGDARLTIAKEPDQKYDLIVFDAFSSDSIPIHLLTEQAVKLFLTKLRPHGVMAIQITNRYMDLEPVIGNVAKACNLKALYQHDEPTDEEYSRGKWPSTWIIVAREMDDFGPLARDRRWTIAKTDPSKDVWTDDYSNILQAIVWELK